MSENVVSVADETFESEVINADIPVIVDFWADWCGPCKMFAPIFEQVAEDYTGKIKFVKANADEASGVAGKYGVKGIPTVIIFKNGNVEKTKVGFMSKSELIAFLSS